MFYLCLYAPFFISTVTPFIKFIYLSCLPLFLSILHLWWCILTVHSEEIILTSHNCFYCLWILFVCFISLPHPLDVISTSHFTRVLSHSWPLEKKVWHLCFWIWHVCDHTSLVPCVFLKQVFHSRCCLMMIRIWKCVFPQYYRLLKFLSILAASCWDWSIVLQFVILALWIHVWSYLFQFIFMFVFIYTLIFLLSLIFLSFNTS